MLIFATQKHSMFQLLHLILALNILLSSSGIMVFEHLCQMRGKTVTYFVKSKSCCAQKLQRKECKTAHSSSSFSRIPCCKDKSAFVKNDPNATLQKINLFSVLVPLCLSPTIALPDFGAAFIPLHHKVLRFYLYKPPPQMRDILVFVQSFLC
jgi:hypothetical protein